MALPSPLLGPTAKVRRGDTWVLLYPWHQAPDPRPDLERISEGYAADSVESWFPIDDHHWYFTRDDLGRLFQETTSIRGDLYLRKTTELRRWLARALDEGEVRAYRWEKESPVYVGAPAAGVAADVPASLPPVNKWPGVASGEASARPNRERRVDAQRQTGLAGDGAKKPKTVACPWMNCAGDHIEQPEYHGKGVTDRGNASSGQGYEAAWTAAGLEPWIERGPGLDPQAARDDYQRDLVGDRNPKPRNEAMIEKAATLPAPEYCTEKHHLISVHLFGEVPKLAHNLRLVGYNANDHSNGICLPYFTLDIVRHDRQCHRGQHPKAYDKKVFALLSNTEEESLIRCRDGNTSGISDEISAIEQRVRSKVLSWAKGWTLRSKADVERADARRRIGLPPPEEIT